VEFHNWDDCDPFPSKKSFANIVINEEKRIFKGDIIWPGESGSPKLLAPEDISEDFADCQERIPAVSWHDRKAWKKTARFCKWN
jgi:hypothetical protein